MEAHITFDKKQIKEDMIMNKFKVNEALIPYLEKLHDSKGITCHVLYDNGTCYMRTPLSGNAFHRQVKVARCQKKEKEEGLLVPILTAETAADERKKKRVLLKYGTRTYILPEQEYKKISNY